MDIDEFVALTEERGRRPSERSIKSFEKKIAATLPDDYRAFLERCNGGCVGGSIWYGGQLIGSEPGSTRGSGAPTVGTPSTDLSCVLAVVGGRPESCHAN